MQVYVRNEFGSPRWYLGFGTRRRQSSQSAIVSSHRYPVPGVTWCHYLRARRGRRAPILYPPLSCESHCSPKLASLSLTFISAHLSILGGVLASCTNPVPTTSNPQLNGASWNRIHIHTQPYEYTIATSCRHMNSLLKRIFKKNWWNFM